MLSHLHHHHHHHLQAPFAPEVLAPRPMPRIDTFFAQHDQLSPVSSTSSDTDDHPATASLFLAGRSSYDQFRASQSRVVRFFNLPPTRALAVLSSTFASHGPDQKKLKGPLPTPLSLWARDGDDAVYAIFPTHADALAALALTGSFSVATALARDLAPPACIYRLPLPVSNADGLDHMDIYASAPRANTLAFPGSHTPPPGMPAGERAYALSSNPPNPRAGYRVGDWICAWPSCGAHNFGRNASCIGCGMLRTPGDMGGVPAPARTPASPRFVTVPASFGLRSMPASPTAFSPSSSTFPRAGSTSGYSATSTTGYSATSTTGYSATSAAGYSAHSAGGYSANAANGYSANAASGVPATTFAPAFPVASGSGSHGALARKGGSYPLLTPSGRQIAEGGKVQNVSTNPLTPCVMYWPDNEPWPEQGQIRPHGPGGTNHPPIMNTGNRGPIEHQPGDWICQKCNYLNWRRRKVCQTCFPYAEGNGDSISSAVQAERISLLANVLNQQHIGTAPPAPAPFVERQTPVRSQSHYELGARTIYQTPELRSVPCSPAARFLPSLSPSSSASAELDDELASTSAHSQQSFEHLRPRQMSSGPALGSIWSLDGEESKALATGVVRRVGSRDFVA